MRISDWSSDVCSSDLAVIDLHIFAVPAVPADEFDATRCCREDRRSAGGTEIDALVHPRIAEQRMQAHAEARGQPSAIDRGAHQALLRRLAAGIEELLAAAKRPAHHLQLLVAAIEPRIEQFAGLGFAGLGQFMFEDHIEPGIRADVALEIDAERQRLDEVRDEIGGNAGGARRSGKGGADLSCNATRGGIGGDRAALQPNRAFEPTSRWKSTPNDSALMKSATRLAGTPAARADL